MDKVKTLEIIGRGGVRIRVNTWRGCVVSQRFRPELANGHFDPPPESEKDGGKEEE